MQDSIHLTVATVCHRQGEFLMVEEWSGDQLVINQPAGHVEAGERLTDAALRETLEETGHQAVLSAVLGLSVFSAPNGVTYYRVSFLADCPPQEPLTKLDKGIVRCHWMSAEQILNAENLRSHLVSMDINRFLSGVSYPLDMISEFTDDRANINELVK